MNIGIFIYIIIERYNDMAVITLKGNPVNTSGNLPAAGTKVPDFLLTGCFGLIGY